VYSYIGQDFNCSCFYVYKARDKLVVLHYTVITDTWCMSIQTTFWNCSNFNVVFRTEIWLTNIVLAYKQLRTSIDMCTSIVCVRACDCMFEADTIQTCSLFALW